MLRPSDEGGRHGSGKHRMDMNIESWLRSIGMERYASAFQDHEIEADLLSSITSADLREIGVSSVGHRRRLLNAIAELDNPEPVATQTTSDARPPHTQPTAAPRQRRQLTILFADLVGSTRLSEQLDEEELSAVMSGYKDAATHAIESAGGFVAQYMGDGIMAFFGWPKADEHDGARAIRGALGILEAMGPLGDAHNLDLNCRIGIATGGVVVGDIVGDSYLEENQVVGRTPNLAARIQSQAAPGEVLIADETRKIVGDQFTFSDRGVHDLKGLKGEVRIWRVDGVNEIAKHDPVPQTVLDFPIVNRVSEIASLHNRWLKACEAKGSAIMLAGEAGIGKSRIVEEHAARVQAAGGTLFRFQCSPFHTNDPLYPIFGNLRLQSRSTKRSKRKDNREVLRRILKSAGLDRSASDTLLDPLFHAHRDDGASLALDAQGRKEKTFQALLALFDWYVRNRNVLLVLEDLHWIDPTTTEFLSRLLEVIEDRTVLVVFSCRSGYHLTWDTHNRIQSMDLKRLSTGEIGEIVQRVSGRRSLPANVVELIQDRSDGVPLFAEELSKTVIESGALDQDHSVPVDTNAIPMTLRDSLIARLDRLSDAREVIQTAAAIGREFSRDVLAATLRMSEADLEHLLGELLRANIIVPVSDASGIYVFKHALMRDAAYETMLRAVRGDVHERIANTLVNKFGETTAAHVLASHWGLAGRHAEAAVKYAEAADDARSRYANAEATAYYRSALEHLSTVGPTDGIGDPRLPQRGVLLEHLSRVLTLMHDVRGATTALREAITEADGDLRRLARLHLLAAVALQQDRENSLAELALAEAALGKLGWQDDPELLRQWTDIQLATLNVHYWSGHGVEMAELATRLEPYVAQMSPEQRAEYYDQLVLRDLRNYRYTPTAETLKNASNYVAAAEETGNLAVLASAQFILGFVRLHDVQLADAEAAMLAGLETAQKSGHRAIEMRCITYLGLIYRRMGQMADTVKRSRESLDLARELGMYEYIGLATANLAWEAWRRGATDEGQRIARRAIDDFQKSTIAYPFEWSAILPMIAVSKGTTTRAELAEMSLRLVDESQQKLPDAVEDAARAVAAAVEADEQVRIDGTIDDLIEAARGARVL